MKPFFTFCLSLLASLFFAQSPINPENITIVRDQWGVPHIYGKTDAETAYGLAWAHAEDDFKTLQEPLLMVRHKLGSVKGKEGAILDFMAFIVNPYDKVETEYETAFSPEFKKVLNGYVQGMNAYAKKHPEELLRKDIFPVTEKDLINGSIIVLAMMTNVQYDIGRIFRDMMIDPQGGSMAKGSNAIAMSPTITKDGKTYLDINSHQPLEGAFAWYEAHVNSEEGWNFLGSVLPGGITPFHGTNTNLGWAHTLNYADLNDVYQLTMHPTKKLHYRFDGEWIALEKRSLKVPVKVGPIRIPIKKTFYWSKYGTTIKNKDGFYSIRFPANMVIHAMEQWYHMNKAQNFEEFKDILQMQAIPGINTIYADKEGNIYLLANGLFPYRDPNYDWRGILPGDTSATLWEDKFRPLEDLIIVENPDCGYVFNMNNTEFNCTCPEENPTVESIDKTIGYLLYDTGRSKRFVELMEAYDSFSYEDFKTVKYDLKWNKELFTRPAQNLLLLKNLDPTKYPDIADIIDVFSKWDLNTNVENKQAAIMSLSIHFLIKYMDKKGILDYNNDLPEAIYADALRYAKKYLLKHFGQLEIELGEFQYLVRGKRAEPVWGTPDVIATMYTEPYKKGKVKGFLGESYIQLVRYDENGPEIESIINYGASNHEDSPHYDDQMELFLQQKLKPMTLDRNVIFKEGKRIYHPQ